MFNIVYHRFGRQFKVYDRILPSQLLDVTDIIEASPRHDAALLRLDRPAKVTRYLHIYNYIYTYLVISIL